MCQLGPTSKFAPVSPYQVNQVQRKDDKKKKKLHFIVFVLD